MRCIEEFETVQRLIAAGVNDCAIARQTGIPRCTVRDWRLRPSTRPRPVGTSVCGVLHDFAAFPAAGYSYLLGMYLGDGCISRHPRAWRLRIVLDDKYPRIIDRCRVVANDRGVRSVRYHFSNRSDDIRGLFSAALDELGIPWTRPRWFEIAVYRKAAVARLDEFVGPKA